MIRDQQILDQLLETVIRFVSQELIPNEAQVAQQNDIPTELVAKMAGLGLFGLSIPTSYGGLGLTMEEECLVALELGRASPAFRTVGDQYRHRQSGADYGWTARPKGLLASTIGQW